MSTVNNILKKTSTPSLDLIKQGIKDTNDDIDSLVNRIADAERNGDWKTAETLRNQLPQLEEKLKIYQEQLGEYFQAIADVVGTGLGDSGNEEIDEVVLTSVVQQIEANASTYKRKKAILYMGGLFALGMGVIAIMILFKKL